MARAGVLKVRRVERDEVIIVQLPDDVLYRTQLEALLACLVTVLAVDVGVPTERDLRRKVPAVGDDTEIKVAGEAIVGSRVDLIDFDDEPRGVMSRHVRDDAQRGGEVLQGLVVAGVQDDLGPGLGDDAQHVGDDATQHPVGLQQTVFIAAAALSHLLGLPVCIGEQSGNMIALHASSLSVEVHAW